MRFNEWWQTTKPAECNPLKDYFIDAWEISAGNYTADLDRALAAATAEADKQRAEVKRLREWLIGDAVCPCCGSSVGCGPECTFVHDAPEAAERMQWVRDVLAGPR